MPDRFQVWLEAELRHRMAASLEERPDPARARYAQGLGGGLLGLLVRHPVAVLQGALATTGAKLAVGGILAASAAGVAVAGVAHHTAAPAPSHGANHQVQSCEASPGCAPAGADQSGGHPGAGVQASPPAASGAPSPSGAAGAAGSGRSGGTGATGHGSAAPGQPGQGGSPSGQGLPLPAVPGGCPPLPVTIPASTAPALPVAPPGVPCPAVPAPGH